jgi:hypothetical protein
LDYIAYLQYEEDTEAELDRLHCISPFLGTRKILRLSWLDSTVYLQSEENPLGELTRLHCLPPF